MSLSALFSYSPGNVRLRLFRDLVLVVLFAVGTLVLAIYLVMTEVRQELAWGQISQATAQVREELRRRLEPTEQQLAILRDWGRAGDLNRDDIDALTRRLIPTLTHHSQLSGLIIADDSGSEYFLMRDEDRWLVRERAPGDDGRLRWHHWESGEDDVPWQDNGGYDPRRRSWFGYAVQAVGSGKAGKEIELAWLKGVAAFMNTDGGILLIGVEDDGNILGLEPDNFENDDKCRLHFKNLFNQHLGPEFSKYVHFDIFDLEHKQVVAIECERAGDPAFLAHKQGESFYIRSGPSNMELTISQALSYLRRRF